MLALIKSAWWPGREAQMVEHLPCKCKVLSSSIPSTERGGGERLFGKGQKSVQ
jgi:hypothetical protein